MDEIEKLEINAEAALEFDDTTHVVALSYARDVLRRFLTDREALVRYVRALDYHRQYETVGSFNAIKRAYEALSQELKDEINDSE